MAWEGLNERGRSVESGKETFIDWEDAKKQLRDKLTSRQHLTWLQPTSGGSKIFCEAIARRNLSLLTSAATRFEGLRISLHQLE